MIEIIELLSSKSAKNRVSLASRLAIKSTTKSSFTKSSLRKRLSNSV
jgi:hypothetical protein